MDLVQSLLVRIKLEMHNSVSQVSMDVLNTFQQYHWPGNVRELENVLTKAVVLSITESITHDLIPDYIGDRFEGELDSGLPIQTSLDEMERYHVLRVFNCTSWHKGETCDIL